MSDADKTTKPNAAWVRHVVDYGPLAAFAIGYVITKNMQTATWVLVAASALALAFAFAMERRIAPMPLLAGGAALLFGGLALIFHDPRLLKIKPTCVNVAYSIFLLVGLWMGKSPLKILLGEAVSLPDHAWRSLTIRYGVYFLFAAALNEVVWRTQSDAVWVWFKFPGLAVLALLFSATQAPFMIKHMKHADEPVIPEPPTAAF